MWSSAESIKEWITSTQQPKEADGSVTCTFIVDLNRQLWINDRRSEHLVCAAGGNVLSAGEITFAFLKNQVEVTEVTNQSTGYCPEPQSWEVVAETLNQIGIVHPNEFTTAYIFRRCEACQTLNIVKDDWFFCGVCDVPLSHEWNVLE